MPPRLAFESVSKSFSKRVALDRLTLQLEPGEILGFLGPNGAGKTTAIHLALGFLHPTSGSGNLLGMPFGVAEARARLGFVPDQPVFFAEPADSSVRFAATLNGVTDPRLRQRVQELLAATGLLDGGRNLKKDARRFSRGMQQRLALAQALANDPDLLILDEPASGLDPAGVLEVRELLREARQAGKSVFFSSHQLAEVEHVCDRIAFLHRGRLVRYGTLALLLQESDRMEAQIRGLAQSAIDPLLLQFPATEKREERNGSGGGDSTLCFIFPRDQQRATLEAVWNAGGEIVSLVPRRKKLEELFFDWTGEMSEPSHPGSNEELSR